MEGGDEGVEMVVDSKDLQQQSKAFDKLTDRVEDRQLDSTRVQEAMASIAASSEADWNAMRLSWTKRWLKEPCVSIKVMQLLPLDTYFTRVKVALILKGKLKLKSICNHAYPLMYLKLFLF
ncbi:hypothetical protein TanjilG_27043 [Lupinus angustifolius]|uniref:Uncharacterized protein n=1 Tax=Lupinus angustifolius TaxID=3871 RepID=A0A4P1QWE2_LUPAN|nr:PREDICTED: uncharacterized protein LOC109329073 isoform X2 [Lupinus angustifolius]OIV95939.1 hypothetical protein TanjilG_27043 [Lupinus angustifolius]